MHNRGGGGGLHAQGNITLLSTVPRLRGHVLVTVTRNKGVRGVSLNVTSRVHQIIKGFFKVSNLICLGLLIVRIWVKGI